MQVKKTEKSTEMAGAMAQISVRQITPKKHSHHTDSGDVAGFDGASWNQGVVFQNALKNGFQVALAAQHMHAQSAAVKKAVSALTMSALALVVKIAINISMGGVANSARHTSVKSRHVDMAKRQDFPLSIA